MNVHISYELRKTPDLEKEINHLVEKLRKRLQIFRPELLHLKGMVEQSSPREGTIVSLNLRLPSGQLAAQRSARTPVAAIKARSTIYYTNSLDTKICSATRITGRDAGRRGLEAKRKSPSSKLWLPFSHLRFQPKTFVVMSMQISLAWNVSSSVSFIFERPRKR